MKKRILLTLLSTTLLLVGPTYSHKAENLAEQKKVDANISMNSVQRQAREAEESRRQKARHFEEWERETDPVKRAKMYIERYAVELGVLVSICLAICNFIVGRSMNARLAFKWLQIVEKPLLESFSYIPTDCTPQEGGHGIATFEDQTSSEYPISLSGRESCKYASFNLVTKPRHDIATTFFTQLPFVSRMLATSRDTLWVEIPIERKTKIVSELLFVQQKELDFVQKAQPHIAVLMQPILPNTASQTATMEALAKGGLVCLAENQESVDAIFADPAMSAGFSDPQIAAHIITLHITDQKLYNNFDLMLKVQVHANWKSLECHGRIVKFLIYVADWLSQKYKLHHTVQEQTQKTRTRKLQAAKEKEEKEEKVKKQQKTAKSPGGKKRD